VVDHHATVHGVEGLSVVDASIMPTNTVGEHLHDHGGRAVRGLAREALGSSRYVQSAPAGLC
jgi:hypothetical protein